MITLFTFIIVAMPGWAAADTPPALPLSTRIHPAGITTEAQYGDWLQSELDRRRAALPPDATPQDTVRQANWILAVACEPHVSRLLLDIHDRADLEALQRLSTETLRLLQSVPENTDDESLSADDLETLQRFAGAISLVSAARSGQPDMEAIERSAIDMAVLLDDDNTQTAQLALLWQSLLYREQQRPERALQILPLALVRIDGSAEAFHLRLLRCRLLAEQQRRVLAQALLLKLEERCDEWFADERIQHNALCTTTWTRLRIADPLSGSPSKLTTELLQGLQKRGRMVLEEADIPCHLLRLTHPAPLLFSEPAPAPQPPAENDDDNPRWTPDDANRE